VRDKKRYFVCNLVHQPLVLPSEMITGPTDREIIQSVLRGNQQAYATLVQQYQRFVFTIVLRYTENREDAEEIAQDVFIKAYRSLSDFRNESKFSTWLYTIATTTCITFLRKKKVTTHSLDNEQVFETAAAIHSGSSPNHLEQKSRAGVVNEAIRLLSADDAQVITLFYKAEQSLEEIGRIMGVEAKTVKVRLHRARQRLKDKMEKHFTAEVHDL
jgi:RNA polymerase sigma factor (sigma-70 family)